ncbi:acyl-CoA mutase large subunit family protein [Rubrivirga marina]|uniref:Methylmalonyl-CoA mutase n=1 Tax=Rubrivirga marina TaxID=1196024 RepID=A0A271J4P6_9BACT|nr:methylmalonyl-CoA mutase family protein [Rubrivirga marina]PAP78268.1 methylmalonyl-CoA mutase [Rubrivirga marina]
MPADTAAAETTSGLAVPTVATEADLPSDLDGRLGEPGQFPFTRGVYPEMYRTRLWTMRQYAGFSTAAESNARYHALLAAGARGLSVAFDLPTQIGYDPDDPMAEGEVGKVGVSIASIEDMRRLFDGIDLEKVTTSMTINATAPILLALYVAVAKEQGADPKKLGGTIQNDILKEYAARGTYIYPPRPSMRFITDTFAWCAEHTPRWNTISISGYHIREAGATAVEELAFTLADGIAYVEAALDAGLDVDTFGTRLSFFFNAHNDFFEEVAKFRAARTLWAEIMRDRFGATDPKAMMLRFHTQTAGSTLQAQQPLVNVPRVTLQALAAVLGGTQSLHTNGFDEALALPTEQAATLALRTQQVIGHESGVTESVDPLAGSYLVERLTADVETAARRLIEEIDAMGGAVAAIEDGFFQDRIAQSAYRAQREIEAGERVVVGVNRFASDGDEAEVELLRVSDEVREEQVARVQALREARDAGRWEAAMDAVERAARGDENVVPHVLDAVEAEATVGEIAGRLREVWGEYAG